VATSDRRKQRWIEREMVSGDPIHYCVIPLKRSGSDDASNMLCQAKGEGKDRWE
jgi:hypothetical protein